MKYIKQILFTLSILLSITHYSFAQTTNIREICPGEKPTLSWQVTSGTATNCPVQGANLTACNFTANPANNFTGQREIDLPSGSCSVSFQCNNTGGASNLSTAVLKVKTLGQCHIEGNANARCPAGQVADMSSYQDYDGSGELLTYYRINEGTGCVAPTATITGGSCIIPFGASSCTVPVSFTTTNLSVSQAGLFDIARTGASSNNYYNGFVYGGTSYMSIPGRAADKADVSVGGGTPITLRVNSMSGASTFYWVETA
jgi:hypothetical protein